MQKCFYCFSKRFLHFMKVFFNFKLSAQKMHWELTLFVQSKKMGKINPVKNGFHFNFVIVINMQTKPKKLFQRQKNNFLWISFRIYLNIHAKPSNYFNTEYNIIYNSKSQEKFHLIDLKNEQTNVWYLQNNFIFHIWKHRDCLLPF